MRHLEDSLQKELIKYFRLRYREPDYLIFAVPNGGKRSLLEATRLKQTGVRAGVSDLIILSRFKTLFIEVKIDKGKQSDNQLEFENIVSAMGYGYFIVRNITDFIQVCENNLQYTR